MNTDPQSPQGSPSEARGSQSHPHPVAEGRQSPGPRDREASTLEVVTTHGGIDILAGNLCVHLSLEKAMRIARDLRAGVEEQKSTHGFGKLLDAAEKEPFGPIEVDMEALAAPGAPRPASQEEGPAGVDLCPICDSAMDSLPNTRLACPRNPECPMPIVWRSDLPKIRRLRAQAPASSPRDLEAKLDRLCESVKHWAQNGMTADLLEVVEWNRASILSAHPPKGETPSEAAGLEEKIRLLEESNGRMAEGIQRWTQAFQALIPEEARARVDAQLAAARAGTAIEKAAREVRRRLDDWEGDVFDSEFTLFLGAVHDMLKLVPDDRASLSSLPQEGAAGEGEPLPAEGEK